MENYKLEFIKDEFIKRFEHHPYMVNKVITNILSNKDYLRKIIFNLKKIFEKELLENNDVVSIRETSHNLKSVFAYFSKKNNITFERLSLMIQKNNVLEAKRIFLDIETSYDNCILEVTKFKYTLS